MTQPTPPSKITLLAATLLSGVLWFFAIDISGNYGFLLWVAPLPILWISLRTSGRIAFVCAWAAYLLGRLSWVSFLVVLMPPVSIALLTLLPPFIFGFYIWLNRWIVLKSPRAWAVLVYPAIVTSFEFLIFNNPVDGTAGSLAYTQVNYLTVIQIASVTGIWGIVFIASLFPAAIVTWWHVREDRKKQLATATIAATILMGTGVFGIVRINQEKAHSEIVVGITIVAEALYAPTENLQQARANIVAQYQQQITALAAQGAQYVLFPEKIMTVREQQKDSLIAILRTTAAQTQATVVGGITVQKEKTRLNLVEFIPPASPVQEYQKRFHVKVFEGDFERGSNVGMLTDMPVAAGMAICKDMDFPAWLLEYQHADLLFVPAWDFVQDGWLHARMAVMRGVENGYTIVRAGRQGRLTVSDYRGKIIGEANAENGNATSLLVSAPVYHIETIYEAWGDWFAWLCLCAMLGFIILTGVSVRFRKQHS